MRAGIGLLSLLVGVAIILMVSFSGPKGGYVGNVIKSGESGKAQANQLSGRDENGITAQASIILDEDSTGGRFRGLIVKTVVPGGPMAAVYGLVAGDEIVEAGQMRLRDMTDPELAKDMVYEGYAKNLPLVIQRGGQELKLTPDSALTSAHPGLFGNPGVTNNNSAPPVSGTPPAWPPQQTNPTQNIPTH